MGMLVNQADAEKIKQKLGKNNLVCCPSPEIALELEVVHGIPHDRIHVLLCLAAAGGDIAIMTKRQTDYYERQEAAILNEAGSTRKA
jgi:hypothetical protein